MNILTNALIAVAAIGVVGYALMSHLQSRAPRPRARAGGNGGGDGYSDTTSGGLLAWKLVLQRQFGKLHR
jgi:hypothetical protein